MRRFWICTAVLLTLKSTVFAEPSPVQTTISSSEYYEGKTISSLKIEIENATPTENVSAETKQILQSISTHQGDLFSHEVFDLDLKKLSNQFDRVIPTIRVNNCSQLDITLCIWKIPTISRVRIEGNECVSTQKILNELDIEEGAPFNRDQFFQSFNKLKEYYIKQGYFEARFNYRLIPSLDQSQVAIDVIIFEGRKGYIDSVTFKGLDSEEEERLSDMIVTRRHDFLSWLTGDGSYNKEAIERDRQTILNFMHDQGYPDASVVFQMEDSADRHIDLTIEVRKGELYHFGTVSYKGNTKLSNERIDPVLPIRPGQVYSAEKLRRAVTNIQNLYGNEGYIETRVSYQLHLEPVRPIYDVDFFIQESGRYKVGIIRVVGNHHTSQRLILQHAKMSPGDVISQSTMKACEDSLVAVGLFDDVKVYTTKNSINPTLGPEYRDVIIEVEERSTGHAGLFFGFSQTDSIFGGLELTENNFNYKGLTNFWRKGLRTLRGAGEFLNIKFSLGTKQQSYSLSWLNPYWNDTLWKVGFDVNYSKSNIISDDYDMDTFGIGIYGTYPLSAYWNYGWKYRFKNTIIKVGEKAGVVAQRQSQNSGIITGPSLFFSVDSTDNTFKPHRGIKSNLEGEVDAMIRHGSVIPKIYPLIKTSWANTVYYPVWSKGTLKFRGDFRFMFPTGGANSEMVPLSERYFLGGENSVRGYKPAFIGPKYPITTNGVTTQQDLDDEQPTGGMSSILFSLEYMQNIFKPIDLFVFIDTGAISQSTFKAGAFRWSVGFGTRVDVGNRIPFIIGLGFPLNPDNENDIQNLYFSMGGQF